MGERKVINKYFPPDFDPTKIPRHKKGNINPNFVVRMMLPMSVRCQTCGEYMYKGKKFNSRKEDVEGPEGEYLGIKIFRFYFKCITCSAEFTIKTDPKNMDYEVEAGVRRNYEPYKDVEAQKKAALEAREASEKDDPMAKLENKTKDSKIEMDILDALDEIRTQNARHASVKVDDVIELHRKQSAKLSAAAAKPAELADEDEAALREFAAAQRARANDAGADEPSTAPGSSLRKRPCTSSQSGSEPLHSTAASSSASSSSAAAGLPPPETGAPRCPPALVRPPAAKKPKLPPGLVVQSKPRVMPGASTHAGASNAAAAGARVPAEAPILPSADSQTEASAAQSDSDSPGGGGLLGLGRYESNSE